MRGTYRGGRRSTVALGLTVALVSGCAEAGTEAPVAAETGDEVDDDADDDEVSADEDDGDEDDGDAEGDTDDEPEVDDEPHGAFDDPPLVDGEPLAADAVSDDLVALFDEGLGDGEVCAALGLEEPQVRSLSLASEGYDYLSEQTDLYDQVLDDRLWCYGPTSYGADGPPLTTYGVGIEVFVFTPTEDDLAFSADTVTTPAGRLAITGSWPMDPSAPEVGTVRAVSVFSVEHGVGLRAMGNDRAAGSSDDALGRLLDEVADRFA